MLHTECSPQSAPGPAEVHVGRIQDFESGGRVFLEVDGVPVTVARFRGRYFAFENRCLHMGGPVGEGMIVGRVTACLDADRRLVRHEFDCERPRVACPWHGYEYELQTGTLVGDPNRRLRTFPVAVRDGDVFVHA